jgi:hypothetical protein
MVQRELFGGFISLEDGRYGEDCFYADRLNLALLAVFILIHDTWKERLFLRVGCFALGVAITTRSDFSSIS